jgi:hypothetical protein
MSDLKDSQPPLFRSNCEVTVRTFDDDNAGVGVGPLKYLHDVPAITRHHADLFF